MFEGITALPPDPILGLIAAHAADTNPDKIDLGVGVYRDEVGGTPILDCVIEAEKRLLATQTTKTYLGPPGVVGFNEATRELLLGKSSDVIAQGRAR
ncbi:MAG: aminotransferase class I/II-fold pyridoxal phosphate-dependent enzyme, partial [Lysobacterales bacterium]